MSIFDCMKDYAAALYDSTCTITEYRKSQGVINNAAPVTASENIPCRISYKSAPAAKAAANAAANGGSAVSAVSQTIKLFLQPDITIKAGSRITVNHRGDKKVFKASGEPVVYVSHQEVELVTEREYA